MAVTEFGCCTYRGAQDRGALGWTIVDRKAQPPRLTEDVVRDEQVQADELVDVLTMLDAGAGGRRLLVHLCQLRQSLQFRSALRSRLRILWRGEDAGWRYRRGLSWHALGAKTILLRARRVLPALQVRAIAAAARYAMADKHTSPSVLCSEPLARILRRGMAVLAMWRAAGRSRAFAPTWRARLAWTRLCWTTVAATRKDCLVPPPRARARAASAQLRHACP